MPRRKQADQTPEKRDEVRTYARERYEIRCLDPEYREKVRQWGRDNYTRKKERLADTGYVPRPRGRPRMYLSVLDDGTPE